METAEFSRIAQKYTDIVYGAALSCCKNKSDEEDAVQNTFFKLLKSDVEFESDEHIRKWLIKVDNMSRTKAVQKFTIIKRAALIAATVAVLFGASNAITYAATGSFWVEHFIHATVNGQEADATLIDKTMKTEKSIWSGLFRTLSRISLRIFPTARRHFPFKPKTQLSFRAKSRNLHR